MARILKNIRNNPKAAAGWQMLNYNYWVDIRSDEIEIKVWDNITDETYGNVQRVKCWDIIKYSELKKIPGFVDQSLWTRISLLPRNVPSSSDTPYEYYADTLPAAAFVDLLSSTIISKPDGLANMDQDYHIFSPLYQLFFPDVDNFNSVCVRLFYDASNEDITTTVTGPSASLLEETAIDLKQLFSPIQLTCSETTVAPDSSVIINVSTDPFISEVYLEQVYGSLNKIRVPLTNGTGSFKLYSDGFTSGETIRVKAGHRKWTGIASFSMTVS